MKAIESIGFVTPRDYNSYIRFNMLKGKYYRIKVCVVSISILLIALFFFANGFLTENKNFFILGGAILLCSLMFLYTLNVNVKRVCNSNAKTVRAKQKTVFGKNGFIFELLFDDESLNEHDEIFFDEIDTIYLAPKAIYIYIEKRSVIIIPKRNLKIEPYEAKAFLEKYIPQKLVVCF